MNLVVFGMLKKQIAAELGASEATVKMHRSQVMKKNCQKIRDRTRDQRYMAGRWSLFKSAA